MNRIQPLDPAQATGKTQQIFNAVQRQLGTLPNLFRVLGNSPAALEGYINFVAALKGGQISARVREQIALVVAEANLCEYCLSAHTHLGAKLGLTEPEITNARHAIASNDKTDAILKLARSIVLLRGEVSDEEICEARDAGLSDSEILETLANVVENIFTNYVNLVARTTVDFPVVKPGEPVAHD